MNPDSSMLRKAGDSMCIGEDTWLFTPFLQNNNPKRNMPTDINCVNREKVTGIAKINILFRLRTEDKMSSSFAKADFAFHEV